MSALAIVSYALLVFVSATAIDFATARYDGAMQEARAGGQGAAHRAGAWSVVLGAVGALGFVLVVNVSMWLMLPELLGYYLGTRLALRNQRQIA